MIIDNTSPNMLELSYCPEHVPSMSQSDTFKNQNEVLIKFLVPRRLKRALLELASERNITLSALLRLITSEYVKRTV